jgi:hypothetical protein
MQWSCGGALLTCVPGLILSQVVFLTYMIVLEKYVNVALSAVLIVATAIMKIVYVPPILTGRDDAERFVCRMTHIYRAKYEEDDIAEAAVLCKGEVLPMRRRTPTDEEARPDTPGAASEEEGSARPGFWTWKMPQRLSFTYATVPNRQLDLARIGNPFSPTNSSFSRLNSIDTLRSAASGRYRASIPVPALSENQPISEDVGSDAASVRSDHRSQALVTRHPPHPAWEDEPNGDHPYDNPNYTKPIGDFLWLPRDPVGKLDLDDTVNMHASLTSAPSAGHIGAPRFNPAETATHLGLSIYSDATSADFSIPYVESPEHEGTPPTPADPPPPTPPLPTGEEEIELPPTIAARVGSGREHDVEEASAVRRRSSTIRSRASGYRRSSGEVFPSGSSRRSIGLGPPPLPHAHAAGMRSFSSGSATSRYIEAYRRSSAMSSTTRARRAASLWAEETGLRPDAHAQATLARSVRQDGPERSRLALQQASVISAHDAVVNEVIVEEAEAADERIREEEDAASRATRRRPWWQAWMFQSAEV